MTVKKLIICRSEKHIFIDLIDNQNCYASDTIALTPEQAIAYGQKITSLGTLIKNGRTEGGD